jgi:hypothetical protein
MEMKNHGVEHSPDPMSIDRLASEQPAIEQGDNVPRFGKPHAPQSIARAIDRASSDRSIPLALKHSKPIVVSAQNGVTELHRQNVLHALQHRMQVAQAKGDRQLIQQLEQELQLFS